MATPARLATYRVQLRADFGFDDLAGILAYLDALGVSHVHASPYLQAAASSTHGYDVVAHDRVSRELGGPAAHARLCDALRARGLGQLLDIVPNHMAIGTPDNAWWWDVLENGPSSRYARYFDVDWSAAGDDRIVLPILGERYADAAGGGKIALVRRGAAFEATYYDHRLPLAPRSLGEPLSAAAARIGSDALAFLADGLAALPLPSADRAITARRHRDKQELAALLARLFEDDARVARAIDDELAAIAADFIRLDALLEHQNWRLLHWTAASSDISYRRFFDVSTLAGLRTEDPRVVADTHRLIFGWLDDGTLDGVRVDHVDGLRDPAAYLQALRARAPHAWIVVEKILAPGERLPASWPVDGTTGYDAMRILDAAFVDPSAAPALEAVWQRFGGEAAAAAAWDERSHEARLEVIDAMFGHERDRLIDLAAGVMRPRPALRDVTRREVQQAITHLIAGYPVYRTYVRPGAPATDDDRARVEAAIGFARGACPDVDGRVWVTLAEVLLAPGTPEEIELALRMQQTTGAVMAKGVEDTLYYRILHYIAANEVGGGGGRLGLSLDEIHAGLAAGRPGSIVATATHDTKRGEDVRARLAALTEDPDAWAVAVSRWSERAAPHRTAELPDRAIEYLWWQTWVGAWPLDPARACAYVEKAARETKRHTSWHRPDAAYEQALRCFVEATLADRELAADVGAFVGSIAAATLRNSLARTLIKLTAPGVPELYQGTELWDFSLVDPDNRRPVDYDARRKLLARGAGATPEAALAGAADGLAKLWLTHRVLQRRRAHAAWFAGSYARLDASGPRADQVIAYARGDALAVIVPRLGVPSEAHVTLPCGSWRDALGDGPEMYEGAVPTARLWSRFPVALLVKPNA